MPAGAVYRLLPQGPGLATTDGNRGEERGGGRVRRMSEDRRLEELTMAESLALLSSVPIGRVVFTHRAMPAIRPVNHAVIGNVIVIRTSESTAISSHVRAESGTVVAYEADLIDTVQRVGWSVVVVGRAHRVTGEPEASRYRGAVHSWMTGADDIIAISPDMVTGFRMVAEDRRW